MTDFVIKTQKPEEMRLRMVTKGFEKSGKTFTTLQVAGYFANWLHTRVGVIDTEEGSAMKFRDLFEFDAIDLDSYEPERYVEAIYFMEGKGYNPIVIDSLSHEWKGKNGTLQQVDMATKRSKSQNSYIAWAEATPRHDEVFEAILKSPAHIMATLRVKVAYAVESVNGKATPRKIGMAPIQRPDGPLYEFDIVCDMDGDHTMVVCGRCPALDGAVIRKPGEYLARTLWDWLHGNEHRAPVNANMPKDVAWNEWNKLTERALAVHVPYEKVNRSDISEVNLRLNYSELHAKVVAEEAKVGRTQAHLVDVLFPPKK